MKVTKRKEKQSKVKKEGKKENKTEGFICNDADQNDNNFYFMWKTYDLHLFVAAFESLVVR